MPMKRKAAPHNIDVVGTLSVAQLAHRWHTTGKAVRRILGRGTINFVQVDGRLRISEEEITRFEAIQGRPVIRSQD